MLRGVPRGAVLLETDAPYLKPAPDRRAATSRRSCFDTARRRGRAPRDRPRRSSSAAADAQRRGAVRRPLPRARDAGVSGVSAGRRDRRARLAAARRDPARGKAGDRTSSSTPASPSVSSPPGISRPGDGCIGDRRRRGRPDPAAPGARARRGRGRARRARCAICCASGRPARVPGRGAARPRARHSRPGASRGARRRRASPAPERWVAGGQSALRDHVADPRVGGARHGAGSTGRPSWCSARWRAPAGRAGQRRLRFPDRVGRLPLRVREGNGCGCRQLLADAEGGVDRACACVRTPPRRSRCPRSERSSGWCGRPSRTGAR